MTDTLVARQRARRDELRADQAGVKRDMSALMAKVEQRGANATFMASEQRQFDGLERRGEQLARDLRAADERLDELVDQAAAQERSAAVRRESGNVGVEQRSAPRQVAGGGRWSVGAEESTYRPDGEHSYFLDLRTAKLGDWDAAQRLSRNTAETRALGNSGMNTGGSGGEFTLPLWLTDEFVALARAGRVTADRLNKQALPAGHSTINIPKITSGSSALPQSTQNTSIANVDPATSAISTGVVTIAGSVVISQQLLDQSPVAFDQVILSDLAADYARTLDRQVLAGAGTSGTLTGLLNTAGVQTIAYNQTGPSVTGSGGFYSTINKAIAAVSTSRLLPPDCILMSSSRWGWVAASYDSTGRPLVTPNGAGYNTLAEPGSVLAEGHVGSMAGLPVWVDNNLTSTYGTSGTEDRVLVMRSSDVMLWESDLRMSSFDAPYAQSLGVLYRVHGYSAMISTRYPQSIAVIAGSALTPPSY